MLERIQIKGFKSIRELDLELRPLNILIGANGAGKSNFLSIFELLQHIVDEKLQQYVMASEGAIRLLYEGRRGSLEIEIDLTFDDKMHYHLELKGAGSNRLFINLERYGDSIFSGGDETGLHDPFPKTHLPSFEEQRKKMIAHLKSWRLYHFHDTSDLARMRQSVNLSDNAFLQKDGANIAVFLYVLKQTKPEVYRLIRKTVQRVAPFFHDFFLEPDPQRPHLIELRWQQTSSEDILSSAYLSDGTLRFMCLATLLLQPNPPSLIIIDEPELGLHPSAIVLLASMLQIASHKSQVIVATQALHLVNEFAPEDIVVVDRWERQSTFKRLKTEELAHWLEDYSVAELWEKNIFGGKPHYEP